MTRGDRLTTLRARRIAAGHSISRLAKIANCSDQTINQLENGGNCDPWVTERIMNALAPPVAITSNTQASPTAFTTASNLFVSTDTVTIAGVTGANADPNGDRVATVSNATTFTVPVNCGVSGGTGGTASLSATTCGVVRL
jgi:DNA-binding XRE family transcriptional regulator